MITQMSLRCALALTTICAAVAAEGDSWAFPKRKVIESPQKSARVTIVPSRDFGIARKGPYGILERRTATGGFARVWVAEFANRRAPADTVISDSGKFVVTFDDYGNLGHGDHVIVLYGGRGEIRRSWSLSDILTEEERQAIPSTVSSRWWSCGSASIDETRQRLQIRIQTASRSKSDCKPIAVDLISGESLRKAPRDAEQDGAAKAEEPSSWAPIRPAASAENKNPERSVDKLFVESPAIIRAIRLGALSEEAKGAKESRILREVEGLLAAGADPNQVDVEDLSALYWSTYAGLYDVARLLVERGADPNVKGRDSWNAPLTWAAYRNQAALVNAMLRAGADANLVFDERNTPLTAAAETGAMETLELLLESGADPNLPTKGDSPLEKALGNYHVDAARALALAGAQPAALDPQYALYWAVAQGDAKGVKAALKACKCQRYPATRVLAWAAESGATPMVEALIRGGVDPNAKVGLWKTSALIEASKMGHTTTAKALLKQGSDVNGRDVYGFTPLDVALLFERHGMIRLLREAGGEQGIGVVPLTKKAR